MQGSPLFDHAVVDALQQLLEGATDVHLLGALADTACERLARTLAGGLSSEGGRGAPPSPHDTVVVLDIDRLQEGSAQLRPRGALIVAAANPRYAPLLLEVLEGSRGAWLESTGLDALCRRLEAGGWEVEDTRRVIVPLALLPFDPVRVPKTVLAYLYAREPEIETYCFLVQARRPVGRPPLTRVPVREAREEFPTIPWKSEAEWRAEAERRAPEAAASLPVSHIGLTGLKATLEESERAVEALQRALRASADELSEIKASPAWRAVVKFRMARERTLPPGTRRGHAYERVRRAVHRLVDRGR